MSDQINAQSWQRWSFNDLATTLITSPSSSEEVALADDVEEQAEKPDEHNVLSDGRGLYLSDSEQNQQNFVQEQDSFDTGYQKGLTEGRQQGLSEAQEQQQSITEQYRHILAEFQQTLNALDAVISSRLMQLALTAARQIIGQPAVIDGTALLNQIQQLLQQEPMLSGKPQLRVHPNDFALVEERLGAILSLHGWSLLADSRLHPGGCKVSAEEGELDASLATRWHELCRLAAPGEV